VNVQSIATRSVRSARISPDGELPA
jgi:hypothetical protein